MARWSGFVRAMRNAALIGALFAGGVAQAQLNNNTSPTSQFKSRPDLHPPIIDFTILRPEYLSPGYIMLAPYRNVDPGPYIYDNWGNLVWSGAGHSGPKTAHTPRACNYKGEEHLCYYEGNQHQGFARGHGVIMNKHYQIVQTVEASGAGASSDMHEFKLTPFSNGTTALLTVYQPRQYDLSVNKRFNVHNGMGWIVEGVFQEVEIGTGRVVFEWRSLDHVDPGDSWTMPGTTDTSGNGLHELTPWDYFHLNSIDKNAEGDFLLSARHVSAIYKISGKDGSILWQLGGVRPTFDQLDFQFSYQHHARWVMENGTHTHLSFFDNGSNTFNSTSDISHAWIIEIDHAKGTARTIRTWTAPEPEGGMLSGSQGNLQLLPNGNCHIGWGEHAFFSEHTADGTPVQYGKLASRPSNVMIYRSNKFNWTGLPLTRPALWTYSKTGKDRMVFYASWNGATEVREWRFFTAANASGPFQLAGSRRKTGFETVLHAQRSAVWSYAQAIDVDGRVLQTSEAVRTFVPSEKMRIFCGNDGCDPSARVEGSAKVSYESKNEVPPHFLSTNRGFNTTNYYTAGQADMVANASALWSNTLPWNDLPEDPNSCSSFSATAAKVMEAGASSSVGSSLFILILGMILGLVMSNFMAFIRRLGVMAAPLRPWAERSRSRFGLGFAGDGLLGSYSRIRDKDMSMSDGADERLVGSGARRRLSFNDGL